MESASAEVIDAPERISIALHGRDARPLGWDSAFYRFAVAVRILTHGAINYKIVYALVGVNGRYINHASPIVRKRTAASLSRLMHSSRYAADLRQSFELDNTIFTAAAKELAASVRSSSDRTDDQLAAEFAGRIWDEICAGLESEHRSGRPVSLVRVERETTALRSWFRLQVEQDRAPLLELIEACFHMMAFGWLDEGFAHSLCPPTPKTDEGVSTAKPSPRDNVAFLLRSPYECSSPVSGVWRIDASRPFTIGRFTDCDVIETDPLVSRLHCRIYRESGAWYVEDAGSRFGTRVLRPSAEGVLQEVFNSADGKERPACRLAFGDCIELVGREKYWFRSIDENELM